MKKTSFLLLLLAAASCARKPAASTASPSVVSIPAAVQTSSIVYVTDYSWDTRPQAYESDTLLVQQIEQCVKGLDEAEFDRVPPQGADPLNQWLVCRALKAADPAPCLQMERHPSAAKRAELLGLEESECGGDYGFYSIFMAVAQNSLKKCEAALSKIPNWRMMRGDSAKTMCRKIFDGRAHRDTSLIDPDFYSLVDRQQCLKVPKKSLLGLADRRSQEECLLDADILAAARSKDARFCWTLEAQDLRERCLIVVGLAARDPDICGKAEKYMKKNYCVDDVERKLAGHDVFSEDSLERIRKFRENLLNSVFQ